MGVCCQFKSKIHSKQFQRSEEPKNSVRDLKFGDISDIEIFHSNGESTIFMGRFEKAVTLGNDQAIKLRVETFDRKRAEFEMLAGDFVSSLREMIKKANISDNDNHLLIFDGKLLKDSKRLNYYGIKKENVIDVVAA